MPGKAVNNERKEGNSKKDDVRLSNIVAAKAVADTIRTSLGPRGMDKMIVESSDEVLLSNDGATIMSRIRLTHPCAKMLVELSKAQDIEAGDGTTTVVVLAGAMLNAVDSLLRRGVHPTIIAEAFGLAARKAENILRSDEVSIAINVGDRDVLLRAAKTSLSSKFVQADRLAPLAVEAVLSIYEPNGLQAKFDTRVTPEGADILDAAPSVDLNNIRVVQALSGTVDETELVNGLVFKVPKGGEGTGRTLTDAKVALIQFQLSPPKTDMESQVIISDYQALDRAIKEEKLYILKIIKKIQAAGCNVLLIQKSILRDAITDLGMSYLQKFGIMVIKDVERDDVPFITNTLALKPISHIDHFTADKLATVATVSEIPYGDNGKIIKMVVQGASPGNSKGPCTLLLRGSSQLALDEAERSFHDALCVVRSLLKVPRMLAGGSAPEVELGLQLEKFAATLEGFQQICVKEYAQAFETIPYTLAENAGLKAMQIVTDLRALHGQGHKYDGVDVRRGCVSDMMKEDVLQPLLVTLSAVKLATEVVRVLLKLLSIAPAPPTIYYLGSLYILSSLCTDHPPLPPPPSPPSATYPQPPSSLTPQAMTILKIDDIVPTR